MKFKKRNVTKKHFEINKFDGVGIELVLPHSRSPALEKKKEKNKKKYYMGIELVLPQSRSPALGSWIIERGIFMCIVWGVWKTRIANSRE